MIMSKSIEQVIYLIDEAITKKCDNREIFTAFDITTELRNKGVLRKHDFLQEIIHEKCRMRPNYTLTMFTTSDHKPFAVYHPTERDACPSIIQRLCTRSVLKQIPWDNYGELFVKAVDSHNRMRFTRPMLSVFGIRAGDSVSVLIGNRNRLFVCRKDDWIHYNVEEMSIKSYTIDEYTNLRISLSTFGFDAGEYKIVASPEGLIVTPWLTCYRDS
jgi:hypothetical protein